MANKAIPVRNLLKFPKEDFVTKLQQPLSILYEDGVILDLTQREIMVNRYVMELTRLTPEVPVVSTHSVTQHYTNGFYVSKTINKTFSVILEDIIKYVVRPTTNRSILDSVYKRMMVIVNSVFNDIVYDNLEYVGSLNIRDFLDIQLDEDLMVAMEECHVKKDLPSINHAYKVLDTVIRTKPKYHNNTIGLGYIAGTVNPNQVKQILGPRGYITEIDSTIFKTPITSSFTLGMRDMYDMSLESRSGAKALFLSTRAIQDSEYFAREMQLVVMVIEGLVDGDCGNHDYMDWLVRDETTTGKSDLHNLTGKYYYNEETHQEEIITKDHNHLTGTTIKLRATNNCKLPDASKVCSRCFGELSNSVPVHANLGHIVSTELTALISQSILGTKHLTTSAIAVAIALDGMSSKFFTIKTKDSYAFKASVLGKTRSKLVMYVEQKVASGIGSLRKGNNVYRLNPSRVASIDDIIIQIEHLDGTLEPYPIPIRRGNRYGAFTYPFLEYIAENGFRLDEHDRYVIDLTNWTTTEPIIKLPQIEFNFLTLAKSAKSVFKHMALDKTGKSLETPEALVQKVFDLVNSKLNINIALIEVIVYAFTVANVEANDYRIGRNSPDPHPARISSIITNRSVGASYAWEQVMDTMMSARSFDSNNAINHPLDVMLRPGETLADTTRELSKPR